MAVLLTLSPAVGELAAQKPPAGAPSEAFPRTRAESSDYRETSTYADVMSFLRALEGTSDRLAFTDFGYSEEGRRLPLVVFARSPRATPAELRQGDQLRVLVFANIHAGEVAGKEAAQALVRDLARSSHREWADSMVLLIAPIYNADGNERIGLRNRPHQHGPVGGMGQRANARGLDLNRDNMKLETAEARSLVRLLRAYDPHVALDLHTTNGTIHAYHLTYSPPLHPNTDPAIDRLLRDRWLPTVTEAVRERYGWEFFTYGNVPGTFRIEGERGWYTFDHRPRFTTNYFGLRNRFGILSEVYSYATFEERITAHGRFVEEVLAFAYAHATELRRIVAAADARSVAGTELALRAEPRRGDSVEVLLGAVAEELNPFTGATILRRIDVRTPERMPDYGSFRPAETDRAPAAYLIPAGLSSVVELLHAHGVRTADLTEAGTFDLQVFSIDSTHVDELTYEGHQQREVWGEWRPESRRVPAGTVVVSLRQPLGRLVFSLLEPRSDDGFVNWNLLDGPIEESSEYPILRTDTPPGS